LGWVSVRRAAFGSESTFFIGFGVELWQSLVFFNGGVGEKTNVSEKVLQAAVGVRQQG